MLKKLNIQIQNMEMAVLLETTPKQLTKNRAVKPVPIYSLHLYGIKFTVLEGTLHATKGEIKSKSKEKLKLKT